MTQIQPWAPPRYTNAHFAEEQRTCYEMRLRGMSIRQIAAATGLSVGTTWNRIDCEIKETLDPLRAKVRELEIERLDRMQQTVLAVLERTHVMVSNGRVIYVEDARGHREPALDSAPVLAAIDRLLKIQERRARLLGLDAAVKVDATVTETTQQDLELIDMVNAAKAQAANAEAQLKAQADE